MYKAAALIAGIETVFSVLIYFTGGWGPVIGSLIGWNLGIVLVIGGTLLWERIYHV